MVQTLLFSSNLECIVRSIRFSHYLVLGFKIRVTGEEFYIENIPLLPSQFNDTMYMTYP